MGVESFSTILKKHTTGIYFEVPLSSLSGKRIAIDTNWLAHKMTSGAVKEVLAKTDLAVAKPDRSAIEQIVLNRVLERIEIFLYYGITPVCVFDGIPHPTKRDGNPKKKAQYEKAKQRYKEAKNALYSADLLFRKGNLVSAFQKQYSQHSKVRSIFYQQLKDVLSSIGIPVLQAQDFEMISNDGEALCATLTMEGNNHCVAAYTIDSDYHAYGGNLQIIDVCSKSRQVNGKKTTEWFAEIRSLEHILSGLTQSARCENPNFGCFTFDMFRDLCIMLGNDFNTNIPRKGPVGCWKSILQYGSVRELSKHEDVTILKYKTSYEMFNSAICKINPGTIDFETIKFRDNGRHILDMYGLGSHFQVILDLIPPFEDPVILAEEMNKLSLTLKEPVVEEHPDGTISIEL